MRCNAHWLLKANYKNGWLILKRMENVVIIGSGLAGLTAAIYNARANLKPVVVSGKAEGGQLMLTTGVENYPGFPEGIMGPELVERIKKQAARFGTRFIDGDAEKVEAEDGGFSIKTPEGVIKSRTVIVASGASARMLGLDSEKKYIGRGVHTCATCDSYAYAGKEVLVVGGGDSAMEESTFIAKHASKVTIVHRRDSFRASRIMQDRVSSNEKIGMLFNSVVQEILGDGTRVTGVKIKDVKTDEVKELKTDAVFLSIGHIPNTKFLGSIAETDAQGFILADKTRTNVPGLFACGDVQDPKYRQAITAAGSGCEAAMEAERYIESIKA